MDKKYTIKYSIEFHTDWHCGSGLTAGADVDALVVKDKNEMPFIPGKTIKGLVREAVEELLLLNGDFQKKTEAFIKTFGNSEDRNAMVDDESNKAKDYNYMKKGDAFFKDATLDEKEYKAITSNDAARFMYRDIASTAIDDNGIAKDHSLRKMEVVVPCTLHGEILNVPEEMDDEIVRSFGFIKRLGQNRNRGLGRCTITVVERKEEDNDNA